MVNHDLLAIKQALQKLVANETLFSFLNTRIILRTGVDLSRVDRSVQNPDSARQVVNLLREMGYDLVASHPGSAP